MTELQKAMVLAMAKANGHPDPEDYLRRVLEHYVAPPAPAPKKAA